ncbi:MULTISPECIES: DUF411 domain-containing protein [Helicobacter]|uniref:DUF411 domain-containing protein n=1 Tax=Helicobacter ibis TaxID=2962633 RepID=A0ABT4VDI0_9HELI|nr:MULTISPECIES: DUF411 domain-containing protein [Helicobacter]MDA3966624.1 DUF411 domain-containing protein [Helicobacter sp. WB40]MDA3968761.1 DUF411 domain-containing protein [Helicobacter ibis]
MKKTLLLSSIFSMCLFADIIELHNSPFCGCCKEWEKYMVNKGYKVNSVYDDNIASFKEKHNIAPKYQSCHTGLIDGYVVEGHVPEDALRWLLDNKPKGIIGISTPGMPIGSPGMEQGDTTEDYPVVLLKEDGTHELYGIYNGHKLITKEK